MPDVATQAHEEWDGCDAAALMEDFTAGHNRELADQQSAFVRTQQKQSPFAQAVDEIEYLLELACARANTMETALEPVRAAYPDVHAEFVKDDDGFVDEVAYVRANKCHISLTQIEADDRMRRLHTARMHFTDTLAIVVKRVMRIANREPKARGAVLPPRIATRVKLLLTVDNSDLVLSVHNQEVRHMVLRNVHERLADHVAAMRALRDNLMAIMWDESLIMPLCPPAKRRRTTVPKVSQ
ncbi:hypothetical protein N9K47_00360 [bacterium]|nr:hypothetical protein [bacterium]